MAADAPRRPRQAKALGGEATSPLVLYGMLVVGLFLLFGLYYWFQLRPGWSAKKKHQISRRDVLGVPDTSHRPAANVAAAPLAATAHAVVPPEKALATMYVPKEVGHRTGQQRVFITNKGLRVYETNEHGWPMPPVKAGLNSQTPSA